MQDDRREALVWWPSERSDHWWKFCRRVAKTLPAAGMMVDSGFYLIDYVQRFSVSLGVGNVPVCIDC
jgi:hypothetical protein